MIVSVRHLPGLHIGEYAPEDVTSINEAAEVDPRSVGLEADAARVIWKSVERLYRGGLHPAIALTVRRQGEVIVDRAIGHLRGNAPHDPEGAPKVPIRHDSLFNLFSGSKAVTAMLVHLLAERGAISLADPVAAYVPEFARRGKGAVTIAQVLTHRAGIPAVPGVAINLDLITDWARVVETVCDAELTRTPGHLPAYHALTGGFVLGEIVRRVSGLDVRAFLRRELGAPLGFRTFSYGVPKERTGEVAHNAYTGIRPLPFASWVLARSLGVSVEEAVDVSNDPRFLTCIVPSANVIGTADEGSRFFQLLLDGGVQGGIRIFRRETVAAAVRGIHPFGIDAFIGLPVRYGMGFMVGGHVISPYGHATRNAFGHLGFSNVLAWADPDRDISVCLMTSGKPFLTPGQVPWLWVPRTIARVCARR